MHSGIVRCCLGRRLNRLSCWKSQIILTCIHIPTLTPFWPGFHLVSVCDNSQVEMSQSEALYVKGRVKHESWVMSSLTMVTFKSFSFAWECECECVCVCVCEWKTMEVLHMWGDGEQQAWWEGLMCLILMTSSITKGQHMLWALTVWSCHIIHTHTYFSTIHSHNPWVYFELHTTLLLLLEMQY